MWVIPKTNKANPCALRAGIFFRSYRRKSLQPKLNLTDTLAQTYTSAVAILNKIKQNIYSSEWKIKHFTEGFQARLPRDGIWNET